MKPNLTSGFHTPPSALAEKRLCPCGTVCPPQLPVCMAHWRAADKLQRQRYFVPSQKPDALKKLLALAAARRH